MPAESHRLTVSGVTTPVLRDVSFHLDAGECVCLQGPSGAGKSRLARALCDLDPSTGEVVLDGTSRDAVPGPAWRRLVALLPADAVWWEELAGAHFPAHPPYPPQDLALDPGILDRPVALLSSGERQRLALLRVLALAPRVLLLDEPTANLDGDNRLRVEALVRGHVAATGTGVLWITHDDHQAERVADRILRMRSGALV